MNFTINHLQHIGIPVTDIKASKVFYQKLGFQQATTAPFNHNGGKGIMVMMQYDKIIIELYQLPEADLNEITNRKDGHVDHIAFDVSDIQTCFEELKSNGFEVVEAEPVFLPFWKNGCKYFNVKGLDGERLEFNQIL